MTTKGVTKIKSTPSKDEKEIHKTLAMGLNGGLWATSYSTFPIFFSEHELFVRHPMKKRLQSRVNSLIKKTVGFLKNFCTSNTALGR